MAFLVDRAHGGAGPSIVALAERNLDEVEKTLGSAFRHTGLEFTVRQLTVHQDGVRDNRV